MPELILLVGHEILPKKKAIFVSTGERVLIAIPFELERLIRFSNLFVWKLAASSCDMCSNEYHLECSI